MEPACQACVNPHSEAHVGHTPVLVGYADYTQFSHTYRLYTQAYETDLITGEQEIHI